MSELSEDTTNADHIVAMNEEEQYSVWPIARDLPSGWHQEGFAGTRVACLEHIGQVWTDIRPASARGSVDQDEPEL